MEKFYCESLTIGESKFGKGIFATRDLPPGTPLIRITGRSMTFEETVALGHHESHSMQVGLGEYILIEPPFLFSNHSCEPNCGINEDLELITIRLVIKDEELTWDYSTSMLERHWTLTCHCETPFCRGIIRDFDLLPSPKQQEYLQQRIVLPFIVNAFVEPVLHVYSVFADK